jgi:hypothetical protein
MRICSSANGVPVWDRILYTAHKSILLSQKNADLVLHKWCWAVRLMILHPSTNKSPSYPEKMQTCNSANTVAIGNSILNTSPCK